MSGEIHELSRVIGALQADVKNLTSAQAVMGPKIDDIHAALPALVARVDDIEPKVQRQEKRGAFSQGVAATIGVVIGSIGAAVWQAIWPSN